MTSVLRKALPTLRFFGIRLRMTGYVFGNPSVTKRKKIRPAERTGDLLFYLRNLFLGADISSSGSYGNSCESYDAE